MSKAVKYAWGRRKGLRSDFKALIGRIRKVEARCSIPDSGRFDFYRYLAAIHVECAKLSLAQRVQAKNEISEGVLLKRPRKGASIFLVLIRATTSRYKADHSRWGQALTYADSHRGEIREKGFNVFVEKNGGIAGMARKAATPQKNPRKSKGADEW